MGVFTLPFLKTFNSNQTVKVVMTEIFGNTDHFRLCFRFKDGPVLRVQYRVQAHRRAFFTSAKCEYIDKLIRKHGDFVTRHVNCRKTFFCDLIHRIIRFHAQSRRGDMNSDTNVSIR